MISLFIFCVLEALTPIPVDSDEAPPNESNLNPPCSMNQSDSQLLDHSTQPSLSNLNPLSPAHSNSTPPFPAMVHPAPSHPLQPEQHNMVPPSPDFAVQPEEQRRADEIQAPSQRNPPPMTQRGSQSPDSIRDPWYRRNGFVAVDGPPNGPLSHEFHIMDDLSKCVLNYFFAAGLCYTSSSWTQCPNLSTSIYIQCFLNQLAFSLFLLAHAVFPRTHPLLAFTLDRLSFLLIVISGYLASMPMYPPYAAIIMFIVVAIVYMFSHLRIRG